MNHGFCQVERHDIGFTLKAESTCHVLNWQPLNLEDLHHYEEMGGCVDSMPEGTETETAGEEASGFGETSERKRASPEDSGPELTAKAFAYSRSAIHIRVHKLQVNARRTIEGDRKRAEFLTIGSFDADPSKRC